MKNILYALFIVLSIIGAGFASGEEIKIFFGEFLLSNGNISIFTVLKIILFAVLFFFVLKFFLSIKQNEKIATKPNKFYNTLSLVCYICVSGAMISALSTILGQVIAFIIAAVCVVIACFGFKYISKIFNYLSVILILGLLAAIVVLIINKNASNNHYTVYGLDVNYYFAGFNVLMYVLCNIFLTSELIFKISVDLTKKDVFKIAIIATSVLTLLLVLISILITGVSATMPLLFMAKSVSEIFHVIYLIILCLAIISTLLTVLYGVKQAAKKVNIKYFIIIPIVFVLGMFNFSILVQYLTIIEGCLCFGYIIVSHKSLN